ncbi:MAG TPA: patatin-like protein [Streptosporangiaceae bacterium]
MRTAAFSPNGAQPPDPAVAAPPGDAVDPAAITVSDTTQDVRFAVAMSGGVSLAVWMGGVAREVNLLQQASNVRQHEAAADPGARTRTPGAGPDAPGAGTGSVADTGWDGRCRDLYLRLLRCLDLTVTVDVLAGTSAGGINAALLGLSSAAGADLAMLRDLWLTTGSMDLLLRDPGEKTPPSLMQGDKVLFTQLARGIEGFYHRLPTDPRLAPAASPGQAVDTTVFITTTMMSGETSRFTDDYGTVVPDVDHHGLFTFHQEDLVPAGQDLSSLTALALAARSSASFPGAFEPSFVPIGTTVTGVPGVPARPDMTRFANMTRSHWVADGGLLDNRPLSPLLSTVLSRRASREVRRVLAFVVPDGGGTPGGPPPAARWTSPLTMASGLRADLDAQLSQSIAGELQLIRAHNDQLNTTNDLRRSLAEMGARLLPGPLITPGLLVAYQVQQGAGLARPLADAMTREVSALQPPPTAWAGGPPPANGLADTSPAQAQLASTMAAILGAGWQPAPSGTPMDEDAAWAAWDSAPDPISRAAWFGLPAFHGAEATLLHLIRLGYTGASSLGQRQLLAGHHAAVTAAAGNLPAPGASEVPVADRVKEAAGRPGDHPRPSLPQVAAQLATGQRRALLIGPDTPLTNSAAPAAPSPDALTVAWEKLAATATGLLRDLASLAVPDGRESRRQAAQALTPYLDYLGPAADTAEMTDRLLNLTIAERALQPADPGIDQPVEFIQVSANTRTTLAPEESTVNKLRGVELHHFAAFYKSSWRAYDWTWGRLDGSGWLVHILLDPRRILAVIEDHYQWPHGERARNFAALLRQEIGLPAGQTGDCLETDLAYLDRQDAPIPVSLPNSALFLARAWQELIAAAELPVIAQRMVADDRRIPPPTNPGQVPPVLSDPASTEPHASAGAGLAARVRATWHRVTVRHRQRQPTPAPTDPWVTTVLAMSKSNQAPHEFAAQLASCPVRWQTLTGEERTPAFLQLATKAAAVATAALTAAPEAPKAIRPILTSARSVTRTGYLATKALGGNGAKTLLAGVVLTILGIVLASVGTVVIGLTGTVIALVGLYLIALGAWGIHRGLLGALIAFTALLAVGALTLPWVRTELWGTTGNSKNGLVPRDVLPWLRGTWWAGLVVLGGILLLAILPSIWGRSRFPANPGTERLAAGDPAQGAPSATEPAAGSQPQPVTTR